MKTTIYVCMEAQGAEMDTVTLRTYPRQTDHLIGSIEVDVIEKGTTLYRPELTAYEPYVKK